MADNKTKTVIIDTGEGFVKKQVPIDFDEKTDPDYLSRVSGGSGYEVPSTTEPGALKGFIIGLFRFVAYVAPFLAAIVGIATGGAGYEFNVTGAVIGGGIGFLVGALGSGFAVVLLDIRDQLYIANQG